MSKTMKAARWWGIKDIRVENVDEPNVTSGRVKIKVEWTGICGSDLHEYLAGPIFIPTKEAHILSKDKAPLIMGHEFSGSIVDVGDGIVNLKVGDRVVVEPILSCGTCYACIRGKYNLCDKLGFHGLSGGGGGFSEYTVVPANMVHKIPDELSFEQGALVEPAAVSLHAVRNSKFKLGDKVAVFGAGTIGLLVVESLRAAGASEIYVVEISQTRAKKALELGATKVIDPIKENAISLIQELSGGGVDVAFEVTGVESVLNQAILSTKCDGECIIVSIWEKEARLHPNDIVLKERSLKGTIAYRDVFPAVINFMKMGIYSADRLVTKKISLDDVVSDGFEELVREKSHIKILVKP